MFPSFVLVLFHSFEIVYFFPAFGFFCGCVILFTCINTAVWFACSCGDVCPVEYFSGLTWWHSLVSRVYFVLYLNTHQKQRENTIKPPILEILDWICSKVWLQNIFDLLLRRNKVNPRNNGKIQQLRQCNCIKPNLCYAPGIMWNKREEFIHWIQMAVTMKRTLMASSSSVTYCRITAVVFACWFAC